jgi:DNA modification methylase
MEKPNRLYYGDNLKVLREHIADESVDLVYLDPPFNSNRNYNVIFARRARDDEDASAQIQAFDDTWHWTPVTDQQYQRYVLAEELPEPVGEALRAFLILLGENDAMAYLVNMAPRLVELYRVLKSTGSLYLHCDPTMSHYLKMMLDAIFGPAGFRNEIVWRRTSTVKGNAGQGARHYGRNTDRILFYTKSEEYTYNQLRLPYSDEYIKAKFSYVEPGTGRRFQTVSMSGPGGAAKGNPFYEVLGVSRYWRYSEEEMGRLLREGRVYQSKPGMVPRQKYYLDEGKGVELQSLWVDIDSINSQAIERLGYPTQKPVALLERIIATSSNPGGVVLDPFCGCGTAIDAAQRLGRQWIGIDIAFIAIDIIQKRFHDRFPGIDNYETFGIPCDMLGARDLARRRPFDFQIWAVRQINARPNEKLRRDKGIDGVARFYLDKKTNGKVMVSVKGGGNIGPQDVRDLLGTVESQKAQMGILITLEEPTPGMIDAVNHGGTYTWPVTQETFPRLLMITARDLLAGKRPHMPTMLERYPMAPRASAESEQIGFDNLATGST